MPGAGFRQSAPPPGFNAADFLADFNQPAQPDPFAAPPHGVGQPTALAPTPPVPAQVMPAQPAAAPPLPVMPAPPAVAQPGPAQPPPFTPQPAAPAQDAALPTPTDVFAPVASERNPFDETANAAPCPMADDAEVDPMAVTTRQAPAITPQPAMDAGQAVPVQVAPPPAQTTAGADLRAAFRAFLEGAGVAGAQIDDSNPEAALRAAGAVFSAMTAGLREVLISRAAIKSEMRIEQTMIAAQGNNALKFSVTAEDAVAALLTPKRRGYMAPLAAAQEALSDIKDHEIAVMAGVQTALMTLLRRFDPDELEKRLSIGGLSAVLPGARKSRYWDSFRQVYGDITREAEDDFQAVFGRPFAKAYTEQSRKE
jgi:type VI secretion system FHA domain protein